MHLTRVTLHPRGSPDVNGFFRGHNRQAEPSVELVWLDVIASLKRYLRSVERGPPE